MSDGALIKAAIHRNIEDMVIDPAGIADFLQQNRKYCYVDRDPLSRTFLYVCTGFNYSEVTLNDVDVDLIADLSRFCEAYLSVDNCGTSAKVTHRMGHSAFQIGPEADIGRIRSHSIVKGHHR